MRYSDGDIPSDFLNILDGCYADTAAIGYNICSSTRMINCDFCNNKLMGLKNATAIKHQRGKLTVVSCDFRNSVGTEILYDGDGENVEWIGNESEMELPECLTK